MQLFQHMVAKLGHRDASKRMSQFKFLEGLAVFLPRSGFVRRDVRTVGSLLG
jgi:hypothetical protein